MAAFALRHSTTVLGSLTYAPAAGSQTEYESLEFFRPKSIVNSSVFSTKRGRRGQHILNKQKNYPLIIGADEIDDDGAFLEAFWEASFKYIAVYSGAAWGDYQLVVTDGGVFPITYEQDEIFPEVSMTLFCTEPK